MYRCVCVCVCLCLRPCVCYMSSVWALVCGGVCVLFLCADVSLCACVCLCVCECIIKGS